MNPVTYMHELIDAGYDFADALYKTSVKFEIGENELTELYDKS